MAKIAVAAEGAAAAKASKKKSARLRGLSPGRLAVALEHAKAEPNIKRRAGLIRAIGAERQRQGQPEPGTPQSPADRCYEVGRAGEWISTHPQDREPPQRPDALLALLRRRLGKPRCSALFGYTDDKVWSAEIARRVTIAGNRRRAIDKIERHEARAWVRLLGGRVSRERLQAEPGYWTAARRVALSVLAGWEMLPGWSDPGPDPNGGGEFIDQLHEAVYHATEPHRVAGARMTAPRPRDPAFRDVVLRAAQEELRKRKAE